MASSPRRRKLVLAVVGWRVRGRGQPSALYQGEEGGAGPIMLGRREGRERGERQKERREVREWDTLEREDSWGRERCCSRCWRAAGGRERRVGAGRWRKGRLGGGESSSSPPWEALLRKERSEGDISGQGLQ